VFATDLYIVEDTTWGTQTPRGMLLDPGPFGDHDYDEAVADVKAGRDWRFPHLVLHHGLGVTWTSVHVVLRKPAAAGAQATS
jgi:hypothetical protein